MCVYIHTYIYIDLCVHVLEKLQNVENCYPLLLLGSTHSDQNSIKSLRIMLLVKFIFFWDKFVCNLLIYKCKKFRKTIM